MSRTCDVYHTADLQWHEISGNSTCRDLAVSYTSPKLLTHNSNYYQYTGNNVIPVCWMPTESFYLIKSDVTKWEVSHLERRPQR